MDRLEYLRSILELIRNTAVRDSTGGVNVAKLGLAAQRSLPDWRTLGYLKFKDVLSDLEAQSLLRIGAGDKGALTVWPVEGDRAPQATVSPTPTVALALQPLRREVWFALTNPFPPGRRLMNRQTGEVRMGLSQPLEPLTAWVELQPVDQQTQRQWAAEFIDQNRPPEEPRLREALSADDWYRRLPLELERCGPFWKSRFNRRRSERVQQFASEWQARNGLPHELVFAAEYPPPQNRPRYGSSYRGASVAEQRGGTTDQNLRQLVLRALATLSTDELCEIALPAKHLIPVLRPDLCPSNASGSNR